MAGSFRLPLFTDYYEPGDLIDEIDGRNVNLQTNVGGGQGEAPSYGWLVTRIWRNDPNEQATELQISDRRAERVNL